LGCATVARPCVTYTVTASKSDVTINHQYAPVASIIVTQQFPRKENSFGFNSTKIFYVTPGILHNRDDLGRYFTRSVTIQKNVCPNACSAAFGKGLRQFAGYGTVLIKILSECDRSFRSSNVSQHDG